MGEQKVKTMEGTGQTDAKAGPKAAGAKKAKHKVPRGRIYVQSTYNNTIITVTDPTGNVVGWGSAGLAGFKGSKNQLPTRLSAPWKNS
jgi:small subunit ribosomal protein S11